MGVYFLWPTVNIVGNSVPQYVWEIKQKAATSTMLCHVATPPKSQTNFAGEHCGTLDATVVKAFPQNGPQAGGKKRGKRVKTEWALMEI